ncbi:MAG TPA: hypothetical protein PKZ76_16760 [Xanthomonadaceae bacterium]|nr:hypothetical protein [Xanthomonadaceae bacterium]
MSQSTTRAAGQRRRAGGKRKPPSVSRLRAPEHMSLPEWQLALRRQFGREQVFEFENMGEAPLFSDYRVRNPASGGDYRVTVRGLQAGANRCTCGDFATNELGTCKHIEFLLGRLERRRGAKAALRQGCTPPYSEVWLQYGAERTVRLRLGEDAPATWVEAACVLFEQADGWRLSCLAQAPVGAGAEALRRTRCPDR